jgi:hypothetical protein
VLRDKRAIRRVFKDGIEMPLPEERGVIGPAFRPAEWAHKSFAELRASAPSVPSPLAGEGQEGG